MNAVLQPSSLLFREMGEADLPKVMEIELEAYPHPWSEGIFSDCLKAGYNGMLICLDDEIIGYAMMSMAAEEAHLLNLCIRPALQGRGYGGALLDEMLDLALAKATKMVFLEVRASNVAARQLYLRYGFNEIGIRPHYYPGTGSREDALVFARELLC